MTVVLTPLVAPPRSDRHADVAEVVRCRIEREINTGALLPGDALDVDALAEYFQVRKAPVLQAVYELSGQGLVSIVPKTGIYVARLSIPELLGLMEMLAEMEGACAKLATRRLTPADAIELERVHRQSQGLEHEADAQAYSRANARFHELIYRSCRNDALMGEIARIRRRTQIYRRSPFQHPSRIRGSWREHGRVLDAILGGEAVAAGQLMVDHIASGGRELADFLANVPARLLGSQVDFPGRRMPMVQPFIEAALGAGRHDKQRLGFDPLDQERPTKTLGDGAGSVASRVRRFVRANVARPLTVADAAEDFGISARTLTRRLAREGSTFQRLKDEIRRDRAIAMISGTAASVASIADELAFSDSSAFHRAFRAWTGATPQSYRETRAGPARGMP